MMEKIKYVLEMTKPPQLALLAFTSYAAYFAAGGPLSPLRLGLLAVVAVGAIGGITALNMVLEADIDSMMDRTKTRPLPAHKLSLKEALAGSLALTAIGMYAAALLNFYVLLSTILAFIFDIPVYTVLLKRRSPLNIIFGGVAGVMQVLGGWAAAAGSYSVASLLLAIAVLSWIPMHIWFIVYYYLDDYVKAKVPMYPVVASPEKVSRAVIGFLLAMLASMWLYWAFTAKGFVGDLLLTALVAVAISKVAKFPRSPTREAARSIFIFANPTLVVAFLLAPIAFPHVYTPMAWLGYVSLSRLLTFS